MSEIDDQPRINVAAGLAWSAVVVVAMLGASFWVWNMVPDGTQVPIHWNAYGEINGYSTKRNAFLFAPGIAVMITALFAIIPLVEPRKQNLMRSRVLYHTLWAGMLIVFVAVQATILTAALGMKSSLATFLVPGIALLFVVIGNVLGKSRSNFLMGVRTPWTLSSDYAWEKTHRWTGRLWVLIGLATIAASPFADMKAQVAILIGGLIISIVAAVVMSYVFWRQDPARQR